MSYTHEAIRKDGDIMIQDAARRLNRSYTWVYYRLPELGKNTYRYKGVIFIRAAGLDRVAGDERARSSPRPATKDPTARGITDLKRFRFLRTNSSKWLNS